MKTEIIFTSEKTFGDCITYKGIYFYGVIRIEKNKYEGTDDYAYAIININNQNSAVFIDSKKLQTEQNRLGFKLK